MRPVLLRPPVLDFFSTKGAYGSPLYKSWLTILTTKRRPGDVGLRFTIAITSIPLLSRYKVNFLTLCQSYVCLLPIASSANTVARTLSFAFNVQYRNAFDLGVKQRLNCSFDFKLVCGWANFKNHLI